MTRKSALLAGVALSAFLALSMVPASAMGDAVAGETVFKKCRSCHKVGEDATNGVGPVLTTVIGRTAGTFADYKYSQAMIDAGEKGLVWDEELLFNYLNDPKKFLAEYLEVKRVRNKMPFKLKKEEDRLNVIAYLATFSDTE